MKALVTGGSRGIGKACAKALRADGHDVIVASRTEGVRFDALDLDSIDLCIAEVGLIDILVANVGGGGRWGSAAIEKTHSLVWDEVYRKNAGAAARFTSLAIPHMLKKRWGRVVTISSIHGKEGVGRPWFTMAKAAEIALMKSLARTPYLASAGITFNTVCPGYIAVDGKPIESAIIEGIPAGRTGTPEEVAAVVAFLCSEKAAYVNGACITVDGGESHSY